jgi:D-glycerate 3-kinase
MGIQFIAAAEKWLRQSTRLPPRQRRELAGLAPTLLHSLPTQGPVVVGISGPPGTGKSTLARMLASVSSAGGDAAAVLSLDDYYLPRARRLQLARDIHPLFETRGVPGTHDLDLLLEHLERLLTGRLAGLMLPQFDKATDDRSTASMPWAGPAPERVFLEGWCIGSPPLDASQSSAHGNEIERAHDADGVWRHAVERYTADYARRLNPRLGRRWFLNPPDWDTVIRWRWQQEQDLGGRKRLDSPREVARFLGTYERLCRHMRATCHAWADRVIDLGPDHCPRN